MKVDVVDGWTGPLDFRLLADGLAYDLTGMTVEMVLTQLDETLVPTTGDITVTDAATGKVRFSPDVGDLSLTNGSVLSVRWKVTDGAGLVVFFPDSRPDYIKIHAVGA